MTRKVCYTGGRLISTWRVRLYARRIREQKCRIGYNISCQSLHVFVSKFCTQLTSAIRTISEEISRNEVGPTARTHAACQPALHTGISPPWNSSVETKALLAKKRRPRSIIAWNRCRRRVPRQTKTGLLLCAFCASVPQFHCCFFFVFFFVVFFCLK